MIKNCYIIRGVSGSGKSSLAQSIKNSNPDSNVQICEADHFFTDSSGVYNFDPSRLGMAHTLCKKKFHEALESGVDVIISNTSVKRSDRNYYAKAALDKQYRVFSVVVENLGTTDVHGLDKPTLCRQRDVLKNNLDL